MCASVTNGSTRDNDGNIKVTENREQSLQKTPPDQHDGLSKQLTSKTQKHNTHKEGAPSTMGNQQGSEGGKGETGGKRKDKRETSSVKSKGAKPSSAGNSPSPGTSSRKCKQPVKASATAQSPKTDTARQIKQTNGSQTEQAADSKIQEQSQPLDNFTDACENIGAKLSPTRDAKKICESSSDNTSFESVSCATPLQATTPSMTRALPMATITNPADRIDELGRSIERTIIERFSDNPVGSTEPKDASSKAASKVPEQNVNKDSFPTITTQSCEGVTVDNETGKTNAVTDSLDTANASSPRDPPDSMKSAKIIRKIKIEPMPTQMLEEQTLIKPTDSEEESKTQGRITASPACGTTLSNASVKADELEVSEQVQNNSEPKTSTPCDVSAEVAGPGIVLNNTKSMKVDKSPVLKCEGIESAPTSGKHMDSKESVLSESASTIHDGVSETVDKQAKQYQTGEQEQTEINPSQSSISVKPQSNTETEGARDHSVKEKINYDISDEANISTATDHAESVTKNINSHKDEKSSESRSKWDEIASSTGNDMCSERSVSNDSFSELERKDLEKKSETGETEMCKSPQSVQSESNSGEAEKESRETPAHVEKGLTSCDIHVEDERPAVKGHVEDEGPAVKGHVEDERPAVKGHVEDEGPAVKSQAESVQKSVSCGKDETGTVPNTVGSPSTAENHITCKDTVPSDSLLKAQGEPNVVSKIVDEHIKASETGKHEKRKETTLSQPVLLKNDGDKTISNNDRKDTKDDKDNVNTDTIETIENEVEIKGGLSDTTPLDDPSPDSSPRTSQPLPSLFISESDLCAPNSATTSSENVHKKGENQTELPNGSASVDRSPETVGKISEPEIEDTNEKKEKSISAPVCPTSAAEQEHGSNDPIVESLVMLIKRTMESDNVECQDVQTDTTHKSSEIFNQTAEDDLREDRDKTLTAEDMAEFEKLKQKAMSGNDDGATGGDDDDTLTPSDLVEFNRLKKQALKGTADQRPGNDFPFSTVDRFELSSGETTEDSVIERPVKKAQGETASRGDMSSRWPKKEDITGYRSNQFQQSNHTSTSRDTGLDENEAVSYSHDVQDLVTFSKPESPVIKKRSLTEEEIRMEIRKFMIPEMKEALPRGGSLKQMLDDLHDITPTSESFPLLDDGESTASTDHGNSSGLRSRTSITSSELDISEQRDDLSTDSMYADDEDDSSSEVLFCKTYTEPERGTEVMVSCTVVNSALRDEAGSSDEFWAENSAAEDAYQQVEFAADAINRHFTHARSQMQDIQQHLQVLRHQMQEMEKQVVKTNLPSTDEFTFDDPERRAITD